MLGIIVLGACLLLGRHAVTEYCAILSTDDSIFFLLPSILRRSYVILLTQYIVQPFKTVMRRVTTGILSEKCVVRRFRRCANVIPVFTQTQIVYPTTGMRRLTTGILSEKRFVTRFRRCAQVIECTYTNLDIIPYYTLRLYGIANCSKLQTSTVCYCTEYCRQFFFIFIFITSPTSLRYKPEGRGIDSRWCHWSFSLT